MRKYNFCAGPSYLPQEVLLQASKSVIEYNGLGMSILEISHRSPEYDAIMDEVRSLTKELLNLDEDHEVLLLHGGATAISAMIPMNFLPENKTGYYVDSGLWANKAMMEAKVAFGNIEEIASSRLDNYSYIPKDYEIPADAAYLHITSNNTAFGTQMHEYPQTEVPVMVDMCSDIFSKVIDYNQFALVYAGVQKNMGAAGAGIAIVNKKLLGNTNRSIPGMFDFITHIKADSIYNTPPVFAIYVSLLMLRWIKDNGGVAVMEEMNKQKAELLYNEVDRNSLFKGICAIEDRSLMNICFVMNNPELENKFLKFAEKADIVNIAGHRLVGGFRVSIYNAMPIESVQHLVKVMQEFEKLQ